MDPMACLREAQQSLNPGERENCADRLEDYFRWRMAGGFQPIDGDETACRMLRLLGVIADGDTDPLLARVVKEALV